MCRSFVGEVGEVPIADAHQEMGGLGLRVFEKWHTQTAAAAAYRREARECGKAGSRHPPIGFFRFAEPCCKLFTAVMSAKSF